MKMFKASRALLTWRPAVDFTAVCYKCPAAVLTCSSQTQRQPHGYSSHHQDQGFSVTRLKTSWHDGHRNKYKGSLSLSLTALAVALLAKTVIKTCQEAECAEPETETVVQKQDSKQQSHTDTDTTEGAATSLQRAREQARDLCQRIKDETGSPGLVVAVSVDGRQVWAQGLGYADVENRVPCTADTVIRIASISKPITMTMVAKLVEEGKLDLHKPIREYVKAWPQKYYEGEKVDITSHQLVTHTAGIRHYCTDCGRKTNKKDAKQVTEEKDNKVTVKTQKETRPKGKNEEIYLKKTFDSVDASLELFKDDPLCSKPGTEYLYSTHGWTLVSAVVEGASGKKFPQLCRQLFKDLGMSHTYLDEAEPLIYNRASYYRKNKKGRLVNVPYVDVSYKWAGGGMLSTVGDLLRFGNIMLYSIQQDAHSPLPGYLKAQTVRDIWTPACKTKCDWDTGGGYGQGWGVVPDKLTHGQCRQQHCYYGHTGGAVGASSVLLILPRQKPPSSTDKQPPQGIVVSILVNLSDAGLNKTALQIAELFQDVPL